MKQLIGFCLVFVLLLQSCRFKEKKQVAHEVPKNLEKDYTVDFPVYDFKGLEPLLHRKDSKTYIINFWATWCKPCIDELPYFERTFAEQKMNNVEMILVSLDRPSMWKKRLVPFVEEKKLKGEVVILDDPNVKEWTSKLDENWGGGIPATLIYNKDKRIFYPHGFSYDELNRELAKFISK